MDLQHKSPSILHPGVIARVFLSADPTDQVYRQSGTPYLLNKAFLVSFNGNGKVLQIIQIREPADHRGRLCPVDIPQWIEVFNRLSYNAGAYGPLHCFPGIFAGPCGVSIST